MPIVISCADDSELADRLHKHLTVYLYQFPMSVDEDEITIDKLTGVNYNFIRSILSEFIVSNPDLVGYSVGWSGDIFTIGIAQNLDQLVLSCEMCGYLAKDENILNIHRKTHGLVFMP